MQPTGKGGSQGSLGLLLTCSRVGTSESQGTSETQCAACPVNGHPSWAETASKYGLLYSSLQVWDGVWHWCAPESLQRGHRTDIPDGWLQMTSESDMTSSTSSPPRGRSQQSQTLLGQIQFHVVSTHTAACTIWSELILTVDQPEVNPSHKWVNSNQHSTATRGPAHRWLKRLLHWLPQDTYYIRSLYQDWKTLKIYLIHRSKQRGSKSGETMKHASNERIEEIPRKWTKWNRKKQSSRHTVKNNTYKNAQGT